MEDMKLFTGENEAAIWNEIAADLTSQGEIFEYSAHIKHQNRDIFFDIDIDLGGGFESGFESTNFMAPVANHTDFRFQMHHQDWVNEIGKFLGMEDVVLGYSDLDEAFIIKTNQPETLTTILDDEKLRSILLKYRDSEFRLTGDYEGPDATLTLLFNTDVAYTNPTDLQEIYGLMLAVLEKIDNPVG